MMTVKCRQCGLLFKPTRSTKVCPQCGYGKGKEIRVENGEFIAGKDRNNGVEFDMGVF